MGMLWIDDVQIKCECAVCDWPIAFGETAIPAGPMTWICEKCDQLREVAS